MERQTATEMIEWAMDVEIEVRECGLQIGELRRLATANAEEQRELYRSRAEARGEFAECDPQDYFDDYHDDDEDDDDEEIYLSEREERYVVNLLRHEYTDYDELREELKGFEAPCTCPNEDCIDGECIMAFEDKRQRAYWIVRRRVHEALVRALPRHAEIVKSVMLEEYWC